jgi:prepilin-type N-terminal cleavage/methylation domain-containing protein
MFKNNKSKIKTNKGFTFVELIVGVAVFAFIIVSVYNAYNGIFNVVYASRAKIEAISIINEQLEIVRNLPYSDVGILGGIPMGKLTHTQSINRDKYTYTVTTTVRNVDDPFDGTLGGTPNDLSPADFKLVEIDVTCVDCRVNFPEMIVTTRVAPKNLETASTNGALFIKVFDANGNPVSDANVHIENNQVTPHIVIDDVTNTNGLLQIVDAPPGVNAYEITVTKSGYSTDQTISTSVGNPNPTKPHSTVVLQQVTQVSFVIDKLSTFNISSVDEVCSPVGSIDFSVSGSKLIGTPNVLKYSQNKSTNSSGLLAMTNMEWDIYSFVNIDTAYDLIGINPISPVTLAPNSSQSVQLVVSPKNPRTLLVTVKDGLTGLPLSGVTARLENNGSVNVTKITGQGFMGQTDWSGGGGQATSTDSTMYFSSDGNIENSNPVGDIQLKNILGSYVLSGVITSSSFDTGSASNFQQLFWNPTAQPVQTGTPNIRVQVATNNDGGTWNYTGPDGTASTYYTVTNQNINSTNNGNRYFRYKIFFDSVTDAFTPNISDISFTFTTLCTPPGQVYYQGLPQGDYTLHLSKTGYQSQDISLNISASWQSIEVTLVSS